MDNCKVSIGVATIKDRKSFNSIRRLGEGVIAGVLLLTALAANAGFVEMPNTNETPGLERHSLLLDLDVPGVKDRDSDPQAGPRLNVKEFRIQGLIEYPDVGITREQIIKQVEAIRFDMMGEGKQLKSGYTLDEIGKVADLIAEIEEETENEHVGPLEVQKLVFLIREQRRQRGITLGMIETVADTITRYYRERGFILAKAYIPQQQVRDGVVTLTILLGELGEVDVHNNKRHSTKSIQNIFADDMGKPVTNSMIEEKLFLLNDLPGLAVQGYFESGSQVGDTKLNVNVTKEQWYDASIRLDNHGSDRSGKDRAYAQFVIHNPSTFNDELSLSVLESYSPQNSTYGDARYSIPIMTPRLKFSVGASTNDFVLNSESAGANGNIITGKSTVADAGLVYQIKRTRVNNYSTGLKVSNIKSTMEIGTGKQSGLDSHVQNTELDFDFDLLNDKAHVLHQGSAGLIFSKFESGGFGNQDKSPMILTLDYSRLSFLKVPFSGAESRLVLRLAGQYAGKSLGAVNQYSLGGPTKSRGFTVNEYYADDSLFTSADWIFKGPKFGGAKLGGEAISSIFQPFIFADYGYGLAHPFEQEGDGTHAVLADIGVGLKLGYTERFHGSLVFAQPVASKIYKSQLDEEQDKEDQISPLSDKMNIYFDLQYSF